MKHFDCCLPFFVIIVIHLCTKCDGRTCYAGSITTLESGKEPENKFSQITCPADDYRCVRVETDFEVEESKGKLAFGECALEGLCKNQSLCADVNAVLPDLNFVSINYSFSSCEEVCCKSNNCNTKAVKQIREDNKKENGSPHGIILNFILIFVTLYATVENTVTVFY